jgi:hypothetical protein
MGGKMSGRRSGESKLDPRLIRLGEGQWEGLSLLAQRLNDRGRKKSVSPTALIRYAIKKLLEESK